MAGFPFMRQAETFLSSLPFILLLGLLLTACGAHRPSSS